MTKIFGWLTAMLLASVLAMPMNADAAPPTKNADGTAAPAHAAPAASHFTPRAGGGGPAKFAPRHFTTPHVTQHRSFVPHASRLQTVTPNATLNTSQSNRATARILRRENIRHAREQRLHGNQLANPNIIHTQPSLASVPNAQSHRRLRRNGTAGITAQVARQGRFASRLGAQARGANLAAHRAWRRGHRAGFVAWYGPVFWPYAYSDIFDYAFWPGGYDDGYWDYAYDDFFDGMFWGQGGPPEEYAYAAPAAPRASYAGVQELCTEPGTGITAWPFAQIEQKVGLNAEQKQLLGDVRKSAADAAATFKASCPAKNTFPLTPPGRLQAMTARLQGTLDSVQIVRPALDKFYNSLSDEQKERFNALGPKRLATNAEANAALPQDSKSCSEAKPGLATLPIEKIADVVKPTDAQQDVFKQLQDATGKAVSLLQAACPEDVPITPPGRLAAMEKRLQAMVEAAKTVKPALDGFYASLSNEQKARFDRIGQQLAQPAG